MKTYNEGGAKADSSIMKPAFSDKATIFGVDGNGKLVGGPIQGLFDIIDNDFKPSPEAAGAVGLFERIALIVGVDGDQEKVEVIRGNK